MRCNKARTFISDAHDGLLPHEEALALERHLAACAECRAHRDDLKLGSRMLKATRGEPTDAFEWTLQLKLNQALQGAAAETDPWGERERRSWFPWLRGFALSSAVGIAASLALAFWLLPSGGGRIAESGSGPGGAHLASVLPEMPAVTASVSGSAAALDRRSLGAVARGTVDQRRGFGSRLVGSGSLLRGDAAEMGPAWANSVRGRNLESLQSEMAWLRDRLRATQATNDSLRALLRDE